MHSMNLTESTLKTLEAEPMTSGFGSVYESSIYRSGITGAIFIMFKGKWQDISTLNINKLPAKYKLAIQNSIFTSNE